MPGGRACLERKQMSENSNPFDGQAMRDAHYQRADMTGSNFDGVNLTDARFYAVLTGARFTDTNLSRAVFDDVNLAAATFNDVNLSGIAVTNANLSGATFDGVSLANAAITDADLTGMTIDGILVSDLLAAYARLSS
jgi:uncharacterized protein YjbI with pentapeptide repeats